MKNQIELLAPAGSKESFIGAINAGANAVYLAGKSFGARKYASNFTNEELPELIRYAHLRNVKVFVTINTIIFEDELDELFQYADFLVRHHVDALIIQDLGIIEQFIQRYPDTEIHASTQMNTYNKSQLSFLKKLGVSRVILARETSINTITTMTKDINIDLEVFVHGALCVSYSGNCLFSAFNGGRSGNRGECAQPCRLPYKLAKNGTITSDEAYLMSTKDLMTIHQLKDIIESGVVSLKIEGRMRKPEYVIATVRAYKEAIEHIEQNKPFDVQKRVSELLQMFNREYTKGYISNEQPYNLNNPYRPNHMGIEVGTVLAHEKGKVKIRLQNTLQKNDGIRIIGAKDIGGKVNRILKNRQPIDVAHNNDIIEIDMLGAIEKGSIVHRTLDIELNNSLTPYLSETYDLIPVTGTLTSYVGAPLTLTMKTPFHKEITMESDYIVAPAKNPSQTKEKIQNQFNKLGNTHYYLEQFDVHTDEVGFVPNSVYNQLRRDGIELLESQIDAKKRTILPQHFETIRANEQAKTNLIVKVDTYEQYNIARSMNVDLIYYNEKITELVPNENDYLYMNRIWEHQNKYTTNNIVTHDFGMLHPEKNIVANHFLNTTNSYTLYSLFKRGVKRVTLSTENSFDNIKRQLQNYNQKYKTTPNVEVIVYGKPDLMISKYCPITKTENVNKTNCNLCEMYRYSLKDDKNNSYDIIRDYKCNVRILHHKAHNLIKDIPKLLSYGVNNIRLDFTTESAQYTQKIIQEVKTILRTHQ